jgi:hypothetical protein
MKIFINGFWGGFIENTDPIKFSFFKNLFELAFNQTIEVGNNPNECDILFESVFSDKTYINEQKWKYTIFFNGESQQRILIDHFKNNYNRVNQISNYDIILTGKITNKLIKTINLPLFIPYIYSNNYINILKNTMDRKIIPKKKYLRSYIKFKLPKKKLFFR